MVVTFVSECEKKALDKTRQVLDAFANRLGNRTWQTVITNEGLLAVKRLLRKTATKNTAVSCHWIRSRSRTELVWIVGNRYRFNKQGVIPVNTTQKNILHSQWENDWEYLPLIKCLAALAGLFHDWGKSSEFFQWKLCKSKVVGDPLRHEWISILLFKLLVNSATDEQWLTKLSERKITQDDLKRILSLKYDKKCKPLIPLPNAASIIAWLILSHHKFPIIEAYKGERLQKCKELFQVITQEWGYENKFCESDFQKNVERCFDYQKGIPVQSERWLLYAGRNAAKMLNCLHLLEQTIADGTWRLIVYHARLALMLGDHWHSSQNEEKHWKTNLDLYANTDSKSKRLKQKLDEHLIGVAKQAVRFVHLLPAFEAKNDSLPRVYDVKPLKQKSPYTFRWQDTAVKKINTWRKQNPSAIDSYHFGFFAVNMASTGKGKTFANAKIMRALSMDGESLRYILALGLRTLTLQTGDEYRKRIKLEKDELAVLIGSRAVIDLHDYNNLEDGKKDGVNTGSESEELLLDNEISFESDIPDDHLTTLLNRDKDRQFLYAPVLSCTIDHLISATETKKGGRYILPSLRLMSSDLVIDEIDDFDGKDLIAIGRLIHLAGMLGRKVMISSATISPDLAEGFYNAYQAGWSLFAQMRKRSPLIGCAWIDEFTTHVQNVNSKSADNGIDDYRQSHNQFIHKRCKKLKEQLPRRKASIVHCGISKTIVSEESIRNEYFSTIFYAVIEMHQHHYIKDNKSDKRISFGLVRVANIKPCIELTRYLLNTEIPKDTEIRTMAYHSQQVLIVRNEQEKHLDAILKRGKDSQCILSNPILKKHIEEISVKNIIFILVATPVEEIGRDHDFDWAIIEPSSYRSFIQVAGRILRHREISDGWLKWPNIGILQYNLKGLLIEDGPVFMYPGYESRDHMLNTHNLIELVDTELLAERMDAQPRICKNELLNPNNNLADLEHECIHQLLSNYIEEGPETIQGWLEGCWWLTAIPQQYVKFRSSCPQLTLYLVPTKKDDEFRFAEKISSGKSVIRESVYQIKRDELSEKESKRLWLYRDYKTLLEKHSKETLEQAALIYGEIGCPIYSKDLNMLRFIYSSQLGLM